MRCALDRARRLLNPKTLRDALDIMRGSSADVDVDGKRLRVTPAEPAAVLRRVDGHLVVDAPGDFTDEILFGLIDSGRR